MAKASEGSATRRGWPASPTANMLRNTTLKPTWAVQRADAAYLPSSILVVIFGNQ